MTTVMTPTGKVGGDVFEVVGDSAFDREPAAVEGAGAVVDGAVFKGAGGAGDDVDFAGEVLAGDRGGVGHDLGGGAVGHEEAAVFAGAGAEVEDVVGFADGVFVVLDDEDGVAEIAQGFEGGDEALVIALVEADGGLVEDVEDAAEARADLGGETDALAFAAGKGGGGAVEAQVAQADRVEEFEALDDFFLEAVGDEAVAADEGHGAGAGEGSLEREVGEVGDGELEGPIVGLSVEGVGSSLTARVPMRSGAADGNGDGERLGAEAAALAAGAGAGGHVLHHVVAVAVGFGFFEVGAQVGEDAMEAGAAGLAFGGTVEEEVAVFFCKLGEGKLEVDFVLVGRELDEFEQVGGAAAGAHGAVEQGLGPVGDGLAGVEVVDGAEAVALRAGAVVGVEGEAAGLELGDVDAAVGAGHGGAVEGLFGVLPLSAPWRPMRTRPLAIWRAFWTEASRRRVS